MVPFLMAGVLLAGKHKFTRAIPSFTDVLVARERLKTLRVLLVSPQLTRQSNGCASAAVTIFLLKSCEGNQRKTPYHTAMNDVRRSPHENLAWAYLLYKNDIWYECIGYSATLCTVGFLYAFRLPRPTSTGQ